MSVKNYIILSCTVCCTTSLQIAFFCYLERVEEREQKKSIHDVLRNTMSRLEHFVEARQFRGNVDRVYNLMDNVSCHLSVSFFFR